RDFHVTGVQTCALPILRGGDKQGLDVVHWNHNGAMPTATLLVHGWVRSSDGLVVGQVETVANAAGITGEDNQAGKAPGAGLDPRSEERRVGKGGKSSGG